MAVSCQSEKIKKKTCHPCKRGCRVETHYRPRATTKEAVITKSITFVGLDVHKNSITLALADAGCNAEVRNYGIIGGGLDNLDRLVRKLSAPDKELQFVYEAGPCGYEIFRFLTAKGLECSVCSPAHTRIKYGSQDLGYASQEGSETCCY